MCTWPCRDRHASALPAPPRACSGNGALPVYGHTRLFMRLAGDVALLFDRDWQEWRCLPRTWSRTLGECFAIFIWGEWRIVVKGPERSRKVLESGPLKAGWPWTPPVTLLGQSCLEFLEDQEADHLRRLITTPLAHRHIVLYAPRFAELAEKCMQEIIAGKYRRPKRRTTDSDAKNSTLNPYCEETKQQSSIYGGSLESHPSWDCTDFEDGDVNDSSQRLHAKIKFEALRSYSFDLVDGPILNMNRWLPLRTKAATNSVNYENKSLLKMAVSGLSGDNIPSLKLPKRPDKSTLNRELTATTVGFDEDIEPAMAKELGPNTDGIETRKLAYEQSNETYNSIVNLVNATEVGFIGRDMMIRWMDRMKNGLCVIKMTFGPEWMHIWRMNEYGYALNARMKVEPIIQAHVERLSKIVPVRHAPGHSVHDPSTMPIPILSLRDNLLRKKEGILGDTNRHPSIESRKNRKRSVSEPCLQNAEHPADCHIEQSHLSEACRGHDLERFQLQHRLPEHNETKGSSKLMKSKSLLLSTPNRLNFEGIDNSISDSNLAAPKFTSDERKQQPASFSGSAKREKLSVRFETLPSKADSVDSLLEHLLQQQDDDGRGISIAVATELSILLWMMMDVGNCWTTMALNLLASDTSACLLVQEEIEVLELEYGARALFSPHVMDKMQFLDATLYEAIRLCPSFLGGLKKTTVTVELPDDGVQIPKNSNVIFCQPTDGKFNIHAAVGKKPHNLGNHYPSLEL
jgi:hypothetical protein